MKNNALITTRELCDLLDITRARVSQMVKQGCPVAERKRGPHGGRSTNHFDMADVRQWILANIQGDAVREAKLIGEGGTLPHQKGRKREVAKRFEAGASSEGWENALQRARIAEKSAHDAYLTCVKSNDLPATAMAQRAWLSVLGELRKMEVDAAKIELQRGEVIPIKVHERIFVEAHTLAASEFRGLAKKVAPLLVGVHDVHEIVATIDKEVRACMRHTEQALRQLG